MVEATDFRDGHDCAIAGWCDRARNRRVFVERQVRARPFVIRTGRGRRATAAPMPINTAYRPSPRLMGCREKKISAFIVSAAHEAHPGLRGIFASAEPNSVGAARAITGRKLSRKVKLIGLRSHTN